MSAGEPGEDAAEIAALRLRAVALEEELLRLAAEEARLREVEHQLGTVVQATTELFAVTERGILLDGTEKFATLFGYSVEEMRGKSALNIFAPEVHEEVLHKMMSGYEKPYRTTCQRKDGSRFPGEVCGQSITYEGRPARVTVLRDITARVRMEEARRTAALQREIILAHEKILAELSTPLLPIGEGTVVLPLIGAINADRAAQVVQTLVEGVAVHQATTAILDITGVPDVDAQVADALLRAARAVKLLGARVILTGIRPEVAQRIVLLGADLAGIVTYGTLEGGIKSSLAGP